MRFSTNSETERDGGKLRDESKLKRGLPWWSSVKTSPFNAKGAGLTSSCGARIPHDLWPKD